MSTKSDKADLNTQVKKRGLLRIHSGRRSISPSRMFGKLGHPKRNRLASTSIPRRKSEEDSEEDEVTCEDFASKDPRETEEKMSNSSDDEKPYERTFFPSGDKQITAKV